MSATQTRILAIIAGLLLAAGRAGAAGTSAGTDISNTASVGYTVGGVSQAAVNGESRIGLNVSVPKKREVIWGSPKKMKNACTRMGVFRITST